MRGGAMVAKGLSFKEFKFQHGRKYERNMSG